MATYRYKFDPTGLLADNKLVDEEHEFVISDVHVLFSSNGLFYTKDTVLVNAGTGATLVLGTDYEFTGSDLDITAETGLETAGGCALTDTTFVGTIKLTTQLVGGPEGSLSAALSNLADAINAALLNPSVEWENITNKPVYFPPELHTHNVTELDDIQVISDEFRLLTKSIVDRRPYAASMSAVIEQQERTLMLVAQMRKAINSVVAVTGSSSEITRLQDQIDNVHASISFESSGLNGIGKTIGSWEIATFNRLTTMVVLSTSTETHSVQVDIAHNGADTIWTRSNELKTDVDLFGLSLSESAGHIILSIIPSASGTIKAKMIALI